MTYEELLKEKDALVSQQINLDVKIRELNKKIDMAKEDQAEKILHKIETMFAQLQELGYAPVAEVELDCHMFCQWGMSWKNIDITTID